ncbi:MAG TPA: RNA 2',3'-cyclic phosphodiesterase [Candidatus Dormibacteraeota bacterium]|nr:RNA 2',3'-cyclic phosphodiesterase [Candidatus Dormibacteraeota bacterium]
MNRPPTYFLAVEVTSSVRRALSPLLEEMTGMGAGIRPVRADGLHLTLRYLGRIDPAQKVAVRAAAAEIAGAGRPFIVAFSGPELAPPGSSPQVVWAPLGAGEVDLAAIGTRLNLALADKGWAPPSQPFRAHCTLARLSSHLSRGVSSHLDELCARSYGEPSLQMPVESLSLMESVPVVGQASSYRRRGQWALGGG